uniref:Uncharacterized protein n=1 Tax=Rhodosorus marinus TaxID=101924 RepID=A0A7S3ADM2_9RHOD|mmetsp:Transcript_97/g.215  ORF Transcript_97/g.215 Transcript_97/m.215 type:complete len:348 (+) Transcript_97:417-1460(+)|eukprot:CAMPEP_0113955798 /NCGR_PEP_ID=MMETSP0011_2-20120614/1614_1 /TAXON_ID=101924 /ORGANISM="Rhodosorus marinus" /LENGTH=347 /DNA_ID=CAMNT_0000965689 /DNA_START=244 /DNA_END=1287 /DNA_ORIENTATION=- /assembly_acc=CAM_ASM_000156
MRTTLVLFAFLAVASVTVSAEDFLKWVAGKPSLISSKPPYISHVRVTADGPRTLKSTLLNLNGEVLGMGEIEIAGPFTGDKSVFISFPGELVVGDVYDVVNTLEDEDGIVVASKSGKHTAVIESIHYQEPFDTLPAEQQFVDLKIVYTTTVSSYIVVAIKDETDSVYLGSRRVNIPEGVDVETVIQAKISNEGLSLPPGKKAIARVDIRPRGGNAKTRFDRAEMNVVGVAEVVTPDEFSVKFIDATPESIDTCEKVYRQVSYEAPDGPVLVMLKLFDSSGSIIKARKTTNLAAGFGETSVGMKLNNGEIVPGETYFFRVDIRRMSAPYWQDKLANENEETPVPAVVC